MTSATRARSAAAKQQREQEILAAARLLASTRPVRDVTLTDIAAEVGLHKSAMLRYFETREQIFLKLTAEGWLNWTAELRAVLVGPAAPATAGDPAERAEVSGAAGSGTARVVAEVFARTLVARPLFCDLLAHTPLNLERGVSFEAVRAYKRTVLGEIRPLATSLGPLLGITEEQAGDLIATATSLAGALWQMAAHGTELRAFYESEPELAHAVVHVEPRLARILEALLTGMRAGTS